MNAHTTPRGARLAALFLVPLLLLGGCTAGSSGFAGSEPAGGAVLPLAPADTSGAGSDTSGTEADTAERQVAKSASVTVTVTDLLASADRVRQIAVSLGGWVVQEDLALGSEPGWRSSSVVSFSVPADQLDAALSRVGEVGILTQRSTSAVDVTEPVQDTDARIRTLEASIARITDLMTRAGTVTEIALVEKELSQRQADLESLQADRERLSTAVERATVSVVLQTPEQSVITNPFLAGLARGWEAFLASIALLLTLVGAVLPFLLVGALVGVPALWWWRRRRAGRASRASARADAPTAAEPVDPTPLRESAREADRTE